MRIALSFRGKPRYIAAMTQPLAALADIAADYDALFCDIWGVVHNGRRLYPGVAAALAAYRAGGGRVVLITNAPKPRDPIPGQLDRIGLPRDCWDAIVTSGDAIRAELAARAPGPVYKIGPAEDADLWAGLDLERAEIDAARFIAISGLNDPLGETPDAYRSILDAALARDLEMLCANPDIMVRVGERLVWCAGGVAQIYEQLGGRVVMAGKPFSAIYRLARQELVQVSAKHIADARILCVGDGVGTDVLGAQNEGLDCLFIASGLHGDALMTHGALDPAKVDVALAQGGVAAKYVMAGLL
jgi:HAD superfamily hydrolase (TIGR01459 family)